MTAPHDLHNALGWGQPAWLWALAFVPLALGLFLRAQRRRAASLERIVAGRLRPALAGSVSEAKRRLRFALLLAAVACLAVAMAKPRLGYTFEEAKRKGRDVILAIDTSRSMLATDVAPNRLARAKLAAQDLLDALGGDRVGLVAFAGSAFLQAPLTVDYSAALATLEELDTNIIPAGGTNLAEAIHVALKAFGKGEGESRVLVLFTDGEELSDDVLAAARKAAGSVRIFPVGVGSGDGSLIPIPGANGGTEFVKDAQGNFVKSRLDETKLREIASLTGGTYIHLQNGPAEMRRLVEKDLAAVKEKEFDARMARRPIERFQWPLGAGIFCLVASMLLGERRRKAGGKTGRAAAGFAVALLLLASGQAGAASGNELFAEKKYEAARKAFEKLQKYQPNSPALHFNKAAADYALGRDDEAVDGFSRALAASDPEMRGRVEYNLGTALLRRALKRNPGTDKPARTADLKNAIQHLQQSRKLSTQWAEDAKANEEIARKELEKPEPPSQKQDNQKKDDDQKKDDSKQNPQQNPQQNQGGGNQKKDDSKQDDSSQKNGKDKQDQGSSGNGSKDHNPSSGDSQNKPPEGKQPEGEGTPPPSPTPSPTPGNGAPSSGNQPNATPTPNPNPMPTPAPSPEGGNPSGEIKAQGGENPEKPAQEASAAPAEPTKPGEMSASQARALLDSLKGEDDQPFKNQRRSAAPASKNW